VVPGGVDDETDGDADGGEYADKGQGEYEPELGAVTGA
jgi:hypothetical protein